MRLRQLARFALIGAAVLLAPFGGTATLAQDGLIKFVVGLAADIIFFYPPILFIIGLVTFFKGLAAGPARR